MEFITGRPRVSDGWSVRDRGLAEALTELEDRVCRDCGQKRELAWNPDTNGWWDVHDVVCEACAALDEERDVKKKPEHGAKPIVTLDESYRADTRSVPTSSE